MPLEKLDANATNVRLYSSEFENQTPVPTQVSLTANYQSADFTNSGGKGLLLHLKIANLAGAPTYRIKALWKTAAGTYLSVWQTNTYNANGDYTFALYPLIWNGSGLFAETPMPTVMPANYAILVVYGGTPATDHADVTVETQLVQ